MWDEAREPELKPRASTLLRRSTAFLPEASAATWVHLSEDLQIGLAKEHV